MAKGTFTVEGQRVRTASTFRFVAWRVDRETGVVGGIFGRSDSVASIRARIQRQGSRSNRYVVVDTSTGEII